VGSTVDHVHAFASALNTEVHRKLPDTLTETSLPIDPGPGSSVLDDFWLRCVSNFSLFAPL
jgi:hypothetical protein